jgi:hypothetical protein
LCAIDHGVSVHDAGIASAETHLPAAAFRREPLDRRLECNDAAGIFEIALQRQHEGMPVDDAGLRRIERGDAGQFRLERARGIATDQIQALDAVLYSLRVDRFDARAFGVVGRNDELAAFLVVHAVTFAERVKQPVAAHAMLRAQRAGRIIHAGMDHFAVARRDPRPDPRLRFRDDDIVTRHRGFAADREADDARAYDQNLQWASLSKCHAANPLKDKP